MAYQKATLIGSSPEGFTAAADEAIDRAEDLYDDLKWAEVQTRGVELATVEEREYQVEVVVSYSAD